MSGQQYNMRNPAVKRIMQELKEIQKDDNPDILAEALEENIFEWHFVIRGAWDTEFERGIYHGRILMPAEYPFKPPAFVMLTPSGRFETGTKICLSISSFHPESWQPSWSVRSALIALIAFMQTPGNGAVGSLETSTEIRKQMALEARNTPPKHSNADRQELINSLHQRMLEMEEKSRSMYSTTTTVAEEPAAAPQEAEETAAVQSPTAASTLASPEPATTAAASPSSEPAVASPTVSVSVPSPVMSKEQTPARQEPSPAAPSPVTTPGGAAATPNAQSDLFATPATPPAQPVITFDPVAASPAQHAQQQHSASWEDRGLTYLAAVLGALLLAVLLRRVILAFMPSYYSNDPLVFSVNPSADIDNIEL